MKHLIARTLTSLVLTIAGLAVAAPAQSPSDTKLVKAHIPFEFNVGNKTLPAGDYSLTQPIQDFLILTNSRGEVVAQVLTARVDSDPSLKTTHLRFYASEGQHFLAEVWRQGDSSGQRLLPSRKKANLANFAQTEAGPTMQSNQP